MNYRSFKIALLLIGLLCPAGPVYTQEKPGTVSKTRWAWFPGASREISHSSSASRDTPLLALHLAPRNTRTAGGDFSVASYTFDSVTLRLGIQGMLELESTDDSRLGSFFVTNNIELWRGIYGYSLALSFDEWARSRLGPRSALEVALSVRHESEHHTASNDEITLPKYKNRPHIGNFVMLDAAVRVPLGDFEGEFRAQHKLFIGPGFSNYTHGPGLDVIVRWRDFGGIQPFSSSFFEYLFGNTASASGQEAEDFGGLGGKIPDAYFFRNLTGIIVKGLLGDLYLYASLDVGHGKGLAVFDEDVRWGAGVRLAFF